MKNLIKTAIAFSNPPHEDFDYLARLFKQVKPGFAGDYKELKMMGGFSVRDIEILTKVSKSQVSRELMGVTR